MTVLRPPSTRAAEAGARVTVLLRAATIGTAEPDKRAEIDERRGLGVALVPGDIASASVAGPAEQVARYDEVLSRIGFTAVRAEDWLRENLAG